MGEQTDPPWGECGERGGGPSAGPQGLLIYNLQCPCCPSWLISTLTKTLRSFSRGKSSRYTSNVSCSFCLLIPVAFDSLNHLFSLKFYPTLALFCHSTLIFIILSWDFSSLSCPLHVPQGPLLGICLFNCNSLFAVILSKPLTQWFVLRWPPSLFLYMHTSGC